MNCLRDIYPQHGGIAVAQLGTATAAIPWLAVPSPSRRETSHRVTLGSNRLSMCRRVQSQTVMSVDLIRLPSTVQRCIPSICFCLLGFLKLASQFGFVYLNCMMKFLKSNMRTLLARSLKLDLQELELVFKCDRGINTLYQIWCERKKKWNKTNIPP